MIHHGHQWTWHGFYIKVLIRTIYQCFIFRWKTLIFLNLCVKFEIFKVMHESQFYVDPHHFFGWRFSKNLSSSHRTNGTNGALNTCETNVFILLRNDFKLVNPNKRDCSAFSMAIYSNMSEPITTTPKLGLQKHLIKFSCFFIFYFSF